MSTVEERLHALESAMADVQHRLGSSNKSRQWLEQVAGSHENWPEFEDVLRLGREFRRTVVDATSEQKEGG